jgi:intracellular septation protein A
MQRGLPTFAVEGFAPILLFYVVWDLAGLVPAILVAAAASGAVVGWQVRRGNGGALAVVALIFVLIQAVVGLASESATVYLAQPVVLSACWGIAYFGSVAIRRPLIGVFANVWYPFPPEFRASEPYRREFSLQSIVWGVYCLARAGLRLGVLLGPGIGSFVVVSLLTGAPIFVALVFWGIWHARRSFSRLVAHEAHRAAR